MNFNLANMFSPMKAVRRLFGDVDNQENNDVEFFKCKPPIVNNRVEGEQKENVVSISGEISLDTAKIEGTDRDIGNLSIVSPELNADNVGGIDLVIVMDVSGSMSPVANDCIKILKHTVECLSSNDRLSVIVFDSTAKHLFPLQPMISGVKSDLKTVIDKCFTGGSTNLASALELLIRVKNDGMMIGRPFKVIVLSDGQPDSGCEGFHLVEQIYTGEIRPEVYSCTFGGSVKADTLRRLLLHDNQHYYHHVSSMEEFKTLVTELGLDRNIVVGTNLHIQFRGAKPLSNLATKIYEELNSVQPGINDNNYELRINQIKSGDVFTTAFDYNSTFVITASYTDISNNRVVMDIKEVDGLGSFVRNHYIYKHLTVMIKAVDTLPYKEAKIERLNYLETLVTVDNLGEFFTDINELFLKTRTMYTNVENHYQHYNAYSQQMSSISSHATPMVSKVYKKYTK
jgi:hypothetical protein